jgi:hypothetical protein
MIRHAIYPESYDAYRCRNKYRTDPLLAAMINTYAEEFAGFCEDYTGAIPLAYMQVTACFVSCHIRIRTSLNNYTRSPSFSPIASREHRFAVYKKFIDESLIHIWHMKHFYRDRYSIL